MFPLIWFIMMAIRGEIILHLGALGAERLDVGVIEKKEDWMLLFKKHLLTLGPLWEPEDTKQTCERTFNRDNLTDICCWIPRFRIRTSPRSQTVLKSLSLSPSPLLTCLPFFSFFYCDIVPFCHLPIILLYIGDVKKWIKRSKATEHVFRCECFWIAQEQNISLFNLRQASIVLDVIPQK